MVADTVWAEVACEVPSEMVDELAEFLVGLSGSGVSIENLFLDTFALDTLEETPVKTVKTYFTADACLNSKVEEVAAYLTNHGPAFPGFSFHPPALSYLREEDWANAWKEHFKPVRIGRRLVVKPTWEEFADAPGDIILEVDPGMAFGTGAHPTTRLCLEALEQIFDNTGPFYSPAAARPTAVLDVGTGSGILGIAAAKLGAGRVVAIDIDPEAILVAEGNIRMNMVTAVESSTTPLGLVTGSFDVVLGNILAGDLVRMAAALVDRLRSGGILILSGILAEQEESVLSGFAGFHLSQPTVTRMGEWSCLSFRRDR
ncbi:MAG: 50S ribosomal protein L11 methyltransferase [Geobacteraceae bacterium]